MEYTTIEVEKREETGDGACRKLRQAGYIPAVVYGGERETVAVRIARKPLLDSFKEGGTENRIFLLKLAGTDKSRHTMVREIQIDPVSRQVLHIDFQRILMDAKIRVKVHVTPVGMAFGVKNQGGFLDLVSREIEIECLPANIPAQIEVDVTRLQVGQHVAAGDLTLPQGVALHDSRDKVIVAVEHARAEKEEAAPAAAAAGGEAKEPEVIKRGKGEEES